MKSRTVFATICSTPIIAALYALTLGVWKLLRSDASAWLSIILELPGVTLMLAATAGMMLGWPIMLLAGLPAYWLLMRVGWRQVWHFMLAGLCVGAACVVLFTRRAESGLLIYWSIATLPGTLTGLVFWLIRRPDRDAPSASPTP